MWGGETHATTNAVFIAHARADVPALCDALEHERKVSAAWKALAQANRNLEYDKAEAAWDALRALGVDPGAP